MCVKMPQRVDDGEQCVLQFYERAYLSALGSLADIESFPSIQTITIFKIETNMAETDVDVGRKRRLPLWMLGVTVADEFRKSANRDQIHLSEDEHSLSQSSCKTKAEPAKRPVKRIPNNKVKGTSGTRSRSLVRCEARNRTRKSCRQDATPRNSTVTNEPNIPMEKSNRESGVKRGVEKQAALKKCKPKDCRTESCHESEAMSLSRGSGTKQRSSKKRAPRKQKLNSCAPAGIDDSASPSEGGEDGFELTMEDLMNMAEEYVKADIDKECEQAAHRECKSKHQLPCVSIFSGNESVCSLEATGNIQEIRGYARERLDPDLNKAKGKERDLSATEKAINISRTGNPAQDMLDLFLGPLLKKPQAEEKKFELMEDMIFAQGYSKPIKSQVPIAVPLTKKKSSLKEKVAMFLD
ncbi:hypothetical protein ACLOJK_017220 [Asimina triloba]